MESKRKLKKRILPQEAQNYKECSKQPITENKNAKQQEQKRKKITLKDLKILFTNTDQLNKSKKHELENLVQREKPHLIALCEVKPKYGDQKQLIEYAINGYKISNHTNIQSSKGRGMVILSHHSIAHLVMDVNCTVDFEEACIVEIRLSGNDLLSFVCIYRSPTPTESSMENNTSLNKLLKSVAQEKTYTHKCIVGDFNFPTINWDNWTTPHAEESKEEKFLEALRDSFFHQHVQEPTRCRGTDNPSTIDLILTGEDNQITNLDYVSPLGKSDHSVLIFNFKCYAEPKCSSKRYIYNIADFQKMKDHLEINDWRKEFIDKAQSESTNEIWQRFKNDILSIRDQFVPKKEVGKPFWKKKGDIPICKDLRDKIKEKRNLHRKWLKSSPSNRQENRAKYVVVRNQVNRMMTLARRSHQRNICTKSKENPKVFWSHVRSKLTSTSGVAPLLESEKDKSSLKYDDREKANILQNQFCSVFTREPDDEPPYFQQRTEKVIAEVIVTKDMVYDQIKELDPSKSCGPDEIHPKMLLELVEYISEPLAMLINKSLIEGVLPDDWKLAHVTPIYKNKGAHNLAVNYRPVSLTSIVCKLMESILRKQVMSHLISENLISNKQYGFISKRSTVTQLLNYLDKCCEMVADGMVVDCIYFDFAKAFDTVPHKRLRKKLTGYGIAGNILQWISEFLANRKQAVIVNGESSSIKDVISGIPQGSVLGPLLFVIYINDLPDHVISNLLLFADDTKLFKEVDSIKDSITIQNDIDTLEKWSHDWLLRFHPDKCHVLTIGKFSNIKHAHRYMLEGEVLEHVFLEKDLGVLIDSDLSFAEHISKQVNKANSVLGLIKRSFENLNPSMFRILYTTFVRPHLEYAQSVWSPKLRKYVNLIEGVQRRATKLVERIRHLPYSVRLKRLEISSLEFRRMFGDMVQVYKHVHFYDRSTIPDKLTLRTRPNRKHHFELQPNFAKDGSLGVQTKLFYYRCVTNWNNLPRDVVDAPSIKIFKERLNRAWENHPSRYLLYN